MERALSPLSEAKQNQILPLHPATPHESPQKHQSSRDPSILRDDSTPSSPFINSLDSTTAGGHEEPNSRSPENPICLNSPCSPDLDQLTGEGPTPTAAGYDDVTLHSLGESPASSRGFCPDDTCFSTFSAVPNTDMTVFARLGQPPLGSPTRGDTKTPRAAQPGTPTMARSQQYGSPLPTPRRSAQTPEDGTTQLLDFTERLDFPNGGRRTPDRGSPSKLRTPLTFQTQALRSPRKLYTPSRAPQGSTQLANLLDFDLPPAPTPRSIPSITARELESLKAGFLSEISSLKANLSGKEAEIRSLQEAKDDAQRRVGDVSEELRNAKDAEAGLATEKRDWEKRDRDMQVVLKDIKSELLHGEHEREGLQAKIEERDKKLEEYESRLAEAESKVTGLQLAKESNNNPSTPSSGNAVDVAVEKVARELHALYKTKHENKVAALKKSYEGRWEKRVRELQTKVKDLTQELEDMRVAQEATMSGIVPNAQGQGEKKSSSIVDPAEIQLLREAKEEKDKLANELSTRVDRLEFDISGLQEENSRLASQLVVSRKENSDLVAAVEQMLSLDPSTIEGPQPLGGAEPFRASLQKPSGLRGPGFGNSTGESRIGMLKRSASGGTGRSGIMSNIEKMGRGRTGE